MINVFFRWQQTETGVPQIPILIYGFLNINIQVIKQFWILYIRDPVVLISQIYTYLAQNRPVLAVAVHIQSHLANPPDSCVKHPLCHAQPVKCAHNQKTITGAIVRGAHGMRQQLSAVQIRRSADANATNLGQHLHRRVVQPVGRMLRVAAAE